MKKKFILVCALALSLTGLQAQRWIPVSEKVTPIRKEVKIEYAYRFDLTALRDLLKNAPEAGTGGSPVEVSLPTTSGKIERFAVYSSPSVAKSMAERYQLGSYSGVGIDDPNKQIRFSTAPNDFQSMLFDSNTGKYEFIEPVTKDKDIYGVFFKSKKVQDGSPFECTTTESESSKKELKQLLQSKKGESSAGIFKKNNDQKYRTYRLAVSVNGEYTQLAGGVPGAAARINATINRVNGVYERDLGIHMIVQDFPQVIFTDPATDPYSDVIAVNNPNGTTSYSAPSAWNLQVQQTLTNTPGIGNGAYDVGHFFGHRGGGGSAGRVGNVCINPANNNDKTSKGAGITSPAIVDQPFGDTFDIDYVAHELGHQFGGRHTMSVNSSQTDIPIEPGSGSTIMGYAGITAANVQMNSDAYFHTINIEQIQAYVNSKNCDINVPVANTPPVIQPLANKVIPKGTPFLLTASATDAENDPMTYAWEQYDISGTLFNSLSSTRTSGATFRSLPPTTSPSRSFPKLETVLSGNLTTAQNWELLPGVARGMNFKVTVRDNHPNVAQQQTQSSLMKLDVGNDGPFKVTSTTVYNNIAGAITWDVVNTNNFPYNVQNVKIDYTTDNGLTWTVITPSTPNDGVEPFSFASLATGTNVKIRVSAIDNVFYAVGSATVSASDPCSSAAPAGITVSGITNSSASINWTALQDATYSLMYRKVGTTAWTTVPASTNSSFISGLDPVTQYEVQIANVCNSTVGTYSSPVNFTTLPFICSVSANPADEYISNVTVTPAGMNPISNNSIGSSYTDYTTDPTKLITLVQGSSNNKISITKKWTSTSYNDGVTAWIDFNKDGYFAESEIIFTSLPNKVTPVTGTFSVPADAVIGSNLIMRVVMAYETQPQNGCSSQDYGEIEDYPVLIQQQLSTSDVVKDKAAIQIFPNPVNDILNVSQVSSKAQFSITNMLGQKVMGGEISDNKISVSRLSSGTYIISIEDKGTTSHLKFVKK